MRRVVVLVALVGSIAVGCSGSAGRSSTTPRTTGATGPPTTAVGAAAPSTLPEGAAPGTTVALGLAVDGATRTYRLHAPAALDPGRQAPLVVVLHGANGNAARVETRYHWNPVSDRYGFFVVYPQGSLDHWNAALDPRADDDVRYLTALLDHLEGSFPVDRTRVYVAGMSNGAAMAYRIGCALSGRVAAIASVEGSSPGCQPSQPVSMVVVHGLADQTVTFAGAQRSLTEWRGYDGCPADAQVAQDGPVTHSTWASCAAGTTVELYAVDGGGHEWPGSSPPLAGHDPPSPDLDATGVIWDFFRRQARP